MEIHHYKIDRAILIGALILAKKSKSLKMRIITINRATEDGVYQCTGDLFECNGIQFCLTNSFDGEWYAIEVLSGMSVYHIESLELTDLGCKRKIRKWIREHPHLFTPGLIERTKKQLNGYGIKYPLNERIV